MLFRSVSQSRYDQVSELGTRSEANLAQAGAASALAAKSYGELSRLQQFVFS